MRAWREANRDRLREYNARNFAEWRADNRERRLEWEKAYRQQPHKRAKHAADERKRRAIKAGVIGSHTAEEFEAVLIKQDYKCFYCGTDIRIGATRDHYIPITKGGSDFISNIRGACLPCNVRKHNKLPDAIGG